MAFFANGVLWRTLLMVFVPCQDRKRPIPTRAALLSKSGTIVLDKRPSISNPRAIGPEITFNTLYSIR